VQPEETFDADSFELEPTSRDFINLHILAAVSSCIFLMAVAAITLS